MGRRYRRFQRWLTNKWEPTWLTFRYAEFFVAPRKTFELWWMTHVTYRGEPGAAAAWKWVSCRKLTRAELAYGEQLAREIEARRSSSCAR